MTNLRCIDAPYCGCVDCVASFDAEILRYIDRHTAIQESHGSDSQSAWLEAREAAYRKYGRHLVNLAIKFDSQK